MYTTLRVSAISSPFVVKGAHSIFSSPTKEGHQEKALPSCMKIRTCEERPGNLRLNAAAKYSLNHGLKDVIAEYRPSYLYYWNRLAGMLCGQLLSSGHHKEVSEGYERVYLEDPVQGKIVLDILPKMADVGASSGSEKVLVVLHGVTGHSNENYMQDMAWYAAQHGYHVVVFNHFAPEGEQDCRLINWTHNGSFNDVIRFIKHRFGSEDLAPQIFMMGFSLGGNFLLRFMGSSAEDKLTNGGQDLPHDSVSAVAAVSSPYDVVHTGVMLKSTRYGLYNMILHRTLKAAFVDNRFKNQDDFVTPKIIKKAPRSVFDFDAVTRVKMGGFTSVHEMYRKVSSGIYVGYIDKPFLVMNARDDEVVLPAQIPELDLLSNPNCVFLDSDFGGHCQFVSMDESGSRRFYPEVVIKFFDGVSEYKP